LIVTTYDEVESTFELVLAVAVTFTKYVEEGCNEYEGSLSLSVLDEADDREGDTLQI
jgi:hypothetical protein